MKILITALLLCSATAIAQQKVGQPAPPGKLVDVGGYRLHLNCTGNRGPTVVLMAGGGDFSFDWQLVQLPLSRSARVCSYDRAGLAWSEPGPLPRTMKQDAYELHRLLKAAHLQPPYLLVGHSVGGLIARIYAQDYGREVAGMVLVDPTHEDTVLMVNNRLVRIRESATGTSLPPVQTLKSSPPKPPTAEDLEQFQFNQKMFGAPRIEPPFDKLTPAAQALRLWFLSQQPRTAAGQNFWAEELQAMYEARAKNPYQLGNTPFIILIPKSQGGSSPPPGIAADEWKRVIEEKHQQKVEMTKLSHNSKLIIAEKSGHHIPLDEPDVVVDAVRQVLESVRQHKPLKP